MSYNDNIEDENGKELEGFLDSLDCETWDIPDKKSDMLNKVIEPYGYHGYSYGCDGCGKIVKIVNYEVNDCCNKTVKRDVSGYD